MHACDEADGDRYNSLVFSSLSANEYYYSVITEDFLAGAPFNLTGDWVPRFQGDPSTGMIPKFDTTQGPPDGIRVDPFDVALATKRLQTMVDYYSNMQASAASWERLENKQCIQAYSDAFISSKRNVLLISSSESQENSVLHWGAADMNSEMTNNCKYGTAWHSLSVLEVFQAHIRLLQVMKLLTAMLFRVDLLQNQERRSERVLQPRHLCIISINLASLRLSHRLLSERAS